MTSLPIDNPSADAPAAIVTADPDFLTWARKEIEWSAPKARLLAELDEGILLFALPASYAALIEAWREAPPIFARHINPVQHTLTLPAGPEAVQTLRAAASEQLAARLDPDRPFSVQTRILADTDYGPFDVNTTLADTLVSQTGAPLDVRNPEQVVSVVVADYRGQLTGFLGVSLAAHNLSDWAGGKRRFAREKGQISRSEFKLLEALDLFDIELPREGRALDLGAAPGGWTRVLRQRGLRVVAVDPAALDPRLTTDRAITHRHETAQAFLGARPGTFDLIVNDMRMDPHDSAHLMVAYAPTLKPKGQALMTVKLRESDSAQVLVETLNILGEAYEIAGARQLFHNRYEVTVYLRPGRDQ